MKIKRIGHVALRVVDEKRSRRFYKDILGFDVSEEDPEHGGVFMTLGDNFHTIDVFGHPDAANAPQPNPNQVGLFHIAFEVGSYQALKDAYCTLVDNEVPISHCTDHISQRSIYFADPDGNRLEIYYEVPNALSLYPEGRGDQDVRLGSDEERRTAPGLAGRVLATSLKLDPDCPTV
jgi:catechol 2,3-dioxygenase